jgi:hypothetical protein
MCGGYLFWFVGDEGRGGLTRGFGFVFEENSCKMLILGRLGVHTRLPAGNKRFGSAMLSPCR